MNTELINDELIIDLSVLQKGLIRGEKIDGPSRERVTGEKYFRQALYIFNEEGKYVDSGFVQINDYTNMCKMIKVCDKSKKTLHLFERWEHYGTQFYKSDKFNITDLVSGNTVGSLKADYVPEFARDNKCCFVGDLEKDEYSEMLLECLNEYSSVNAPPRTYSYFKKNFEDKMCDCNLLEKLDIYDLLKSGEIDEAEKQEMFKSLTCDCKNIPPKPELSREQKVERAELKLQAQSEIASVFLRMKLKKEVKEEAEV
jgi:hypothetical protein